MRLNDAIQILLSSASGPMTPQDLREGIKKDYPLLYGTPSQVRLVQRGHYQNIDHAVLANIYSLVRSSKRFSCERSSKPLKVSLAIGARQNGEYKTGGKAKKMSSASHINNRGFGEKIIDILANAERYHEAFYQAETFGGPSLHFHRRALETRNSQFSVTHLEYIYATLASWGMHRMGKGGSKMLGFDEFQKSIDCLKERLVEARKFTIHDMDDSRWILLKEIFLGIRVMASLTSIIGNSKAMHHLLPDIIPPIDREYTLWYLLGNKAVKNDLDEEWDLMMYIISGFFVPVAADHDFDRTARMWVDQDVYYPWDTSLMKIVDNLIIGKKKLSGSSG